MPELSEIQKWPEKIRQRYENYLRTSFFFKDPKLRDSFRSALREEESLLKGPFPEQSRSFETGLEARELARECFPGTVEGLIPALIDRPLYMHQERAVRAVHLENQNIIVATGTASGKTESFLYSILFELYRQHLSGELEHPGVRAMILYPMNALANDQRERLGKICEDLRKAASGFKPTFGQYIGQTPENARDTWRNAALKEEERLTGELIFREQMRNTPPHILLTNYSMLEYLLIRPDDSPLFDGDRGLHWQFIVLDEAHQYRGTKGMEIGMLIRRLKQRLRMGGRQNFFRCIATSATISSGQSEEDKKVIAEFGKELFGEPFSTAGIIFGQLRELDADRSPGRYHAFLRALEGAFLVHRDGEDIVVLNRKSETGDGGPKAVPLEIALCRECGQHYYVGQNQGAKLEEAVRDPSHSDFGVEYYLPSEDGDEFLCRRCGILSASESECGCEVTIRVRKCQSHEDNPDQLKECGTCGYQRGGIGDPVQEIVHGSDAPNAVIATALHELLPEEKRKILAFADSRQEAAFFAWYAEDSYEKLRDRNLILKAIKAGPVDPEGLSIDDLRNRLLKQWEQAGLFRAVDTREQRNRRVLTSILREVLTEEKRLSLSGVGLINWFVKIPDDLKFPDTMRQMPWEFTDPEARALISYFLDEFRLHRSMSLTEDASTPAWGDVSSLPMRAYSKTAPRRRWNVSEWGARQSTLVKHFLRRLLENSGLSDDQKRTTAIELAKDAWDAFRSNMKDPILLPGKSNGTFQLNPLWVRVKLAGPDELWECGTCATLTTHNVRGICPRNRCPGSLLPVEQENLKENHYRILYENADLPPALNSEEHTAQIKSDEARERQNRFKNGDIHLLSSSTTFEVGVDLGDLDTVFLRNVPPEPFNYIQRVGRAGRREDPGLAVTYCRRNPHDLYHYENPVGRIIEGTVHPPYLQMTNEKIILRHLVATVLSEFFKQNPIRFTKVEDLIVDWSGPLAASDLRHFCRNNDTLRNSLRNIVPESMHDQIGLDGVSWIDRIAGPESRLARVEEEVCSDYQELEVLVEELIKEKKYKHLNALEKRKDTIADEKTLDFLSRKAVIPKYGFPVDVVELENRYEGGDSYGVLLQRDLSQAIAEYAPGGKVIANKREWESCGVKTVTGKTWTVRNYRYENAQSFTQWNENDSSIPPGENSKYLIPEFGFVTPLFERPKEPHGRVRRLYTTRPFFQGFDDKKTPEIKTILGVQITKAQPGTLVILCEGRHRSGFYICRSCGAHMTGPRGKHESPSGYKCPGTLERFSLGHELLTDVVRLQFPQLSGEWETYSVAYAVLLGAAETLDVPGADLNVTVARGVNLGESAIVLYDDVPGGAGLVAQLERENIFKEMLRNALERVQGNCGCDQSCYGCLRSYRNQFAHPYLNRMRAWEILNSIVAL